MLIDRKNEILSHFLCKSSGNCCRAGGYVRVTFSDMQAMADQMGMDVLQFQSQYVVRRNGWHMISTPTHRPRCFLNDQNRCDVYYQRPLACRTYPDWPDIWESDELLGLEAERCPGLARAIQACGS